MHGQQNIKKRKIWRSLQSIFWILRTRRKRALRNYGDRSVQFFLTQPQKICSRVNEGAEMLLRTFLTQTYSLLHQPKKVNTRTMIWRGFKTKLAILFLRPTSWSERFGTIYTIWSCKWVLALVHAEKGTKDKFTLVWKRQIKFLPRKNLQCASTNNPDPQGTIYMERAILETPGKNSGQSSYIATPTSLNFNFVFPCIIV